MNQRILHLVSTRLFTTLQPEHDEKWLESRLLIFKTFTLPSFINQSSQDFQWILLVSAELPAGVLDKLRGLIKDYPNFHIIEVTVADLHDQPEYTVAFNQFISDYQLDYDFLLHSRIDGDDAWNSAYVGTIRQTAQTWVAKYSAWQNYSGLIFNFPYGQVCYPFPIRNKHGIGRWKRKFFSQSVDVLTIKGKLDTFYKFPHSKTRIFAKQNNFRCIYLKSRQPMWLYVQHVQNDGLLRKWHRWFLLFEKLWMPFHKFCGNDLCRYGITDKLLNDFNQEYNRG